MRNLQIIAAAAPAVARSVRLWIDQLGGLGFIPLWLLDNSVIPLPGSMDVLTSCLSARNEQLWLYYALMAPVGSVIGGFATYSHFPSGDNARPLGADPTGIRVT